MPLGAALNYWGWELQTNALAPHSSDIQLIIQTFCTILRSGMKPHGPQQWPLKCSLLSVLPLPCFTLPSLISGITFQDRVLISSSAYRSGWKRREAAWMSQQEKTNVRNRRGWYAGKTEGCNWKLSEKI